MGRTCRRTCTVSVAATRKVPAGEAGAGGRVASDPPKNDFHTPRRPCAGGRTSGNRPSSVERQFVPADRTRSAGFFRSCRLVAGAGVSTSGDVGFGDPFPRGRARRRGGRGRRVSQNRVVPAVPIPVLAGPRRRLCGLREHATFQKMPLPRRNPPEVPLTHFSGLGIYPALFYRILDRQIQQPFAAGVPQAEIPSDAVRPRALDFPPGTPARMATPLPPPCAESTDVESVPTEWEPCESRKENRVENDRKNPHRPDFSRALVLRGRRSRGPVVYRQRHFPRNNGCESDRQLSVGRSPSPLRRLAQACPPGNGRE